MRSANGSLRCYVCRTRESLRVEVQYSASSVRRPTALLCSRRRPATSRKFSCRFAVRTIVTASPGGLSAAASIAMTVSVSLSVCLSLRAIKNSIFGELREVLCSCYRWPWFGPLPVELRYVMHFRFCGRRRVLLVMAFFMLLSCLGE